MPPKKIDKGPIGLVSFIFLILNILFSHSGSRQLYNITFWQAIGMAIFFTAIIVLLNLYLQQVLLLKAITLLAFLIACWYDLKIVAIGIEKTLGIKESEETINNFIGAKSWTGLLLALVVLTMTSAFSFVLFDNDPKD